LADEEGLERTHVPKSVRKAEKKAGLPRPSKHDGHQAIESRSSLAATNDMMTPSVAPSSLPSNDNVSHQGGVSVGVVFSIGMIMGVMASAVSMVAYRKFATSNQYQLIE
jgi:hypothetical protein